MPGVLQDTDLPVLTRLLNHYGFWLAVVSLIAAVAERIRPWRPRQPVLRPLLLQDLFWFGFNGYALGLLIWPLIGVIGAGIVPDRHSGWASPVTTHFPTRCGGGS